MNEKQTFANRLCEQETREKISEICRKMWQLGWVAGSDGNVSVKLSKNHFLVTPSGISKSDITPESVILVSANHSADEICVRKPSSEFKMHLRCYTERGDVNAVIHAHPPCATAFAVAGEPLDDYSIMETVLTIGSVPVTPYATPSTEEVGNSIAPFLPNHDALLLQNHGALTVGCDLITAFHRMETLEHSAKIILNTRILGGAEEISRSDIETLCKMRSRYGLTGKHPGYKKYS
ncbi:MAG: class II aldolase/adducin family protein [Oscillospiraceae bacterium]|nr:class II aldolase/adducin family protein [Oscillospiraceae bacterium]